MTRARGTRVVNLLKLPVEWQAFLAGLTAPRKSRNIPRGSSTTEVPL
jgi:hypothetical protein